MCENRNRSGSSPGPEERLLTPEVLTTGGLDEFLQSLRLFAEHEKRILQCPAGGPDETRYMVYNCVFNKLITRATVYKRLLLTIKAEYDDVIRALQRREEASGAERRAAAASTSQQRSLLTCERRADQLMERISVLQSDSADLQEEISRRRSVRGRSSWISGVTVAESEDPEALDRHLRRLEAQRAALLDQRSRCVSTEVEAELDAKLQSGERRRDQLSEENIQLTIRFKRLKFVSERLWSWKNEQQVPLEELLKSTVENIRETHDDGRCINTELFEDDEPSGVDESKQMMDHLDRFIELFDSAQYEEAALLAARSPGGVLRNLDTVELFKGVQGPPGSAPPLLLLCQALLMTVSAGDELSADLSVQLVSCFLQHGVTQLVSHAVNNNKLTSSEELGDLLTEHAQKNPAVEDLCLALAGDVFNDCRTHRKSALSMCKRGLIHSAAEFMKTCKDLTADDCLWVLCRSPSLSLLQMLTAPQRGQAAILSVGVACSTLLMKPQLQLLPLQLLDDCVRRGRGVLAKVVLEDSSSSVDLWTNVASLCSDLNRADLSRAILSVLLDQSGTRVLSPDLEGARLMDHVFL